MEKKGHKYTLVNPYWTTSLCFTQYEFNIWVDLALAVFSLQVIVYAFFLIRYEVAKGNPVMETLQVLMAQLAATMAVATGTTLIFLQGVDFVMFLTQRHLKRIQQEEKKQKMKVKKRAKLKNANYGKRGTTAAWK